MSKKNFCILQVLIVIMVVVAILASTYAWADRGSEGGNKLNLEYGAYVNGSGVTAVTRMVGSDECINDGAEYNVSSGEILRFETVLTNACGVPCNVSLFLKDVTCLNDFIVCVSEPTHEFREHGDVVRDWVRVVPSCQIGAWGTVTFRWSVELESEGRFLIGAVVLEHF